MHYSRASGFFGASERFGALFLGLVAACGPAPVELIAGLSTNAVILVRQDLADVKLEAMDLLDGRPLRLDSPSDTEVTLSVLTYESTLSVLELPVGILDFDPEGGAMPTADRIFTLGGDDVSTPVELTEMPDSIASLRLAATNPCGRFELVSSMSIPAPEGAEVRFALPIDEERVLMGLNTGLMYVVDRDEVVEFSSPLQGRLLMSGVRTGDGTLWLADRSGTLVRGHPDRGFVPGPRIPLERNQKFVLAASPTSAASELYVATSTPTVYELLEGRWSRFPFEATAADPERSRLQLGWLAPGRLALTGVGNKTLIEVDRALPATVHELPVPFRPNQDALSVLGWVEGVGGLVGTRHSAHFKRTPIGWEFLPEPATTPVTYLILDLGDGSFVSGGESGRLAQWISPRGQCPPIQHTLDGQRIGFGVLRADGFMTFSDASSEGIGLGYFRRL